MVNDVCTVVKRVNDVGMMVKMVDFLCSNPKPVYNFILLTWCLEDGDFM